MLRCPPMSTPHTYWTVAEAASELRVSTATIYRQIEARKIPVVRIGDQWRINAAECIRAATPAWPTLAEHCAPPSERRR